MYEKCDFSVIENPRILNVNKCPSRAHYIHTIAGVKHMAVKANSATATCFSTENGI